MSDDTHAELARLRVDLASVRAALAQTQRALDAERAARRNAEADTGWWHATVANYVTSGTVEDRAILRTTLAEATTYPHPGAQLLSKLEAAQRIITAARDVLEQGAIGGYTRLVLSDAIASYDAIVKAGGE